MGTVEAGTGRSTCRPTASASSRRHRRGSSLGANHGRRQVWRSALWIGAEGDDASAGFGLRCRRSRRSWIAALPVLSAQQIDMAQRQQEVRARETAFARSMADGALRREDVELVVHPLEQILP